MVPMMALPPAIPLTLQHTVISVAPVTVAVKVCVLPNKSEAVAGAMVTVTEGGGGGAGGTTADAAPAPLVLPAQPMVKAVEEKRTRSGSAAKRSCGAL